MKSLLRFTNSKSIGLLLPVILRLFFRWNKIFMSIFEKRTACRFYEVGSKTVIVAL